MAWVLWTWGHDYHARRANGVRVYAIRLHRDYRPELLPRDTLVTANLRMARRDASVVGSPSTPRDWREIEPAETNGLVELARELGDILLSELGR